MTTWRAVPSWTDIPYLQVNRNEEIYLAFTDVPYVRVGRDGPSR